MSEEYPEIRAHPIDPVDPIQFNGENIGFSIVNFWQWNQSDLIENRNRGILAEFIVKTALGIKGGTRLEWDAYDLESNKGIKIEVKSASYIQAWDQSKMSTIKFDIAPKKQLLKDNSYSDEMVRAADVYIFCLLHHQDQDTINPMELSQWTFYLVLTKDMDREIPEQKSISISTIERLPYQETNYKNLQKSFSSIVDRENG